MNKELGNNVLEDITGGMDTAEKYIGPCTFYIVKEGDRLSAVAEKFQTTPAVIRTLNGMSANQSIRVGQKLLVPNRAYQG